MRCRLYVSERRVPAAEPAAGRAAAAADRRADAARRARGELLVPAPPGRLRVDRGAGRGPARRRHGLRRGLRLRRARRAAPPSVVGVDANPEAHEHARLRYVRPNLRFERDLVESFAEPCDAVVFLQTIEHVAGRRRDPRALQVDAGAGRRRLRLDPEPADPGAARGGEVRQPLARARVPRRGVPRALRGALLRGSSCSASSTPASCASTSWRSGSAGTASTSALGLTKPLLRPLHAGDRRLRLRPARRATSTARWTSSPSATPDGDRRGLGESAGDLAIVLHSPHALRRGLRDLPVRRGVAVRRGDPLLPAGAGGRRAS